MNEIQFGGGSGGIASSDAAAGEYRYMARGDNGAVAAVAADKEALVRPSASARPTARDAL